jgi:DNA replication protein DnaC
MGDAEVGALAVTFDYLAEKRRQASIETLLRLSRLPRREPKTFDGFDFPRIQGRDASVLAKPTCLIVDEVGRCTFDRACTDLFFDVIGRRYEKEGPNTMILTSNVAPSAWDEFFTGDDALLCARQGVRQGLRLHDARPELPRARAGHLLRRGRPAGHQGEGHAAQGSVART